MIYLAVITGITGFFNEANAGTINVGQMATLNFGDTVSGQISPNIGGSSNAIGSQNIINTEDFTNASTWNTSTVVAMNPLIVLYNPWTQQNGVGYVLTGTLGLGSTGHFGIEGVMQQGGVYDVVYQINNTGNYPFALDISQAAPNTAGYSAQVQFTQSQITLYQRPLGSAYQAGIFSTGGLGVNTLLESSNNYNLITGVTHVETIYNPVTELLTVNINGGQNNGGTTVTATLDSSVGPAYKGTLPIPPTIFAGVECANNGFTVQKINSQIQTVQTTTNGVIPGVTGIPFVDAIIAAAGSLISVIAQWGALIGVFFGLSTNSVVPFWLWACTGVPCISTLFLMGLELFRGT